MSRASLALKFQADGIHGNHLRDYPCRLETEKMTTRFLYSNPPRARAASFNAAASLLTCDNPVGHKFRCRSSLGRRKLSAPVLSEDGIHWLTTLNSSVFERFGDQDPARV